MTEATRTTLDDDRLAIAAQRVIERFKLRNGNAADAPVGLKVAQALSAADPQSLRLAIDGMLEAIDRMERIQTARDLAFTGAIERLERGLAKAEGRIDALSAECAAFVSQPTIDLDVIRDAQHASLTAAMGEFSGMFELTRALMDEVRQLHAEATRGARA